MQKIKVLVTVIAVVFGVAFLDGVLEMGLAGGVYVLLGLINLVSIIWLLKLVYSKDGCKACVDGKCE